MASLNLELRAMLDDLNNTVLDTDDIDRLIERILSDDPALTRADFSYQSPNLSALAQALRSNQHLQQLILQGVDLRGSIDVLCATLRGSKARLRTLDLSFANLDVSGLVRVFEVVTAVPSLVEVVVMGNPGADNAMSMRLKRLLDINRSKSAGTAPLSPTSASSSTSTPPHTSPPLSPTATAVPPASSAAPVAPTTWGDTRSIGKTIISSFSRSNSSDLNSSRTSSPSSGSSSSTTSTSSKKKKKDKDSSMSSSVDDDKKKKKAKKGRDKDQQLRVSLLEKRVAELEASERELLGRIQEMEQAAVRGEPSADGRMSRKISSIISKKSQADKKMTISFRNVVVTERLASVGGSNAGVFSCYVDGWQCAMKELDIENIDDLSLTAFEGEIRLLELLPPHNNIVRYLYHERIEGKLRLYMTKYAGSLGSRLRELRKLVDAGRGTIYSAKAIVKYCLDIAQGIAFLHQHNIVHRDLKSDNIFVMLNERKDIHHLAIADFDTAKQVSKAELAKTCIGTPQWMAPEVMTARHDTEYGFEVDIYSFGLVLYEFLTVKIPYEDTPPFQIAPLVMQGKKPPLPALPEAYDGLIAIYEKCTQLNPASRPSAAELKEMFVALM